MSDEAQPVATTTEEGSGNAQPEIPRDPIAESVDAAVAEVKGKGGATETATPADEPAKVDDASAKETTDESAKAEPSFYSKDELDAMKPGELIHLDMNRVPAEVRGIISAARKMLAQGFQELADAKKQKSDSSETKQLEEKQLTDEELYDLAMEGPAGFRKSQEIFLKQSLPGIAKALNVDPEIGAEFIETRRLNAAIDLATETFEDLADPAFKAAVGAELRKDQKLALRVRTAVGNGDTESAALAIEAAAARATKAQVSAAAKTQQKTDAETEKQKAKDDKATRAAKENSASVASRSTTRGAQPKAGKMTVDRSIDEAVAAVRTAR